MCGSRDRVQAAHTIGRKHDETAEVYTAGRVKRVLVVDSLDIVPLCEEHHQAYDKRALDLLPYLTHAEQAAAVRHVGIESARRRLTSTH